MTSTGHDTYHKIFLLAICRQKSGRVISCAAFDIAEESSKIKLVLLLTSQIDVLLGCTILDSSAAVQLIF